VAAAASAASDRNGSTVVTPRRTSGRVGPPPTPPPTATAPAEGARGPTGGRSACRACSGRVWPQRSPPSGHVALAARRGAPRPPRRPSGAGGTRGGGVGAHGCRQRRRRVHLAAPWLLRDAEADAPAAQTVWPRRAGRPRREGGWARPPLNRGRSVGGGRSGRCRPAAPATGQRRQRRLVGVPAAARRQRRAARTVGLARRPQVRGDCARRVVTAWVSVALLASPPRVFRRACDLVLARGRPTRLPARRALRCSRCEVRAWDAVRPFEPTALPCKAPSDTGGPQVRHRAATAAPPGAMRGPPHSREGICG